MKYSLYWTNLLRICAFPERSMFLLIVLNAAWIVGQIILINHLYLHVANSRGESSKLRIYLGVSSTLVSVDAFTVLFSFSYILTI